MAIRGIIWIERTGRILKDADIMNADTLLLEGTVEYYTSLQPKVFGLSGLPPKEHVRRAFIEFPAAAVVVADRHEDIRGIQTIKHAKELCAAEIVSVTCKKSLLEKNKRPFKTTLYSPKAADAPVCV